ncbi:MAG TPA: phosphoenolpyruvate carboxylase, partial [Ilumatobacteraceae bacterium]|nr:phosphoenolpyruvate carboxylase [Ilumatobacteraceae bacterium]
MSDLAVTPERHDDAVSDDIRLLGRLLGDAIRATEGDDTFDLVERVRLLAVEGRRDGVSSVAAIREALAERPLSQQLIMLRALDWLSLLANTAEDVHVELRGRRPRTADGGFRPGTLDASIERLRAAGIEPRELVAVGATLQVSPVITAHPTEVRRKTILQVLEEIGELLVRRNTLVDRPG